MGSSDLAATVAVIGGVVLAVLLFVPVAAVRYRRAGRMTVGDVVALVAVPVYGLALWTYTLLPLPDPATIVCQEPLTRPFAFVDRARGAWTGSSPSDLLRNPVLLQVFLNVALFVPLGAILRWRRRVGLVVAATIGFLTSLAIELTQLTGIWGLYRCAYRYFEVDDLIANTTGAVVGWAVVAVLVRGRSPERPAPIAVTAGRRLVGLLCDGLTMVLTGALAVLVWRAWQLEVRNVPWAGLDRQVQARVQWGAALAVQAVAVLGTGRTVGEWAIAVRASSPSGRGAWARRLVRLLVGPGLVAALASANGPVPEVAIVVLVVAVVAAAVLAPTRGLGGLASGTTFVPAPPRDRAHDR